MIVYNYSANTHTENNQVNMKPLIRDNNNVVSL